MLACVLAASFCYASELHCYAVKLASPLAAGKRTDLSASAAVTHAHKPFPAEILQSQRQQMVTVLLLHAVSPYVTQTSKTVVQFPSAAVVSHDTVKPSSLSGATLTYGPYKDVPAFTMATVKVHYETTAPFLAITSLVKEIEVSHWGSNVAVEETVALKHDGAKLKGSFSRFDYQRNPTGAGAGSVRMVTATLPLEARDVYYRDIIGNISTSALRYTDEAAELELRPRFPLFGGWKTEFYMGYNLPLGKFLSVLDSGEYLLTINVAASFDEVPMDSVEVRVILPEGAYDWSVHLPFDHVQPAISVSSRKTYLDTAGRPVVTFSLANLVPDMNVPFQLKYSLASSSLLHEPLLLCAAFAVLFLAAIVYQRIDLSLAPVSASGAEDLFGTAAAIVSNIIAEIEATDDALAEFKNTRNTHALNGVRDRTRRALASLTKDLSKAAADAARLAPAAESDLNAAQAKIAQRLEAQTRVADGLVALAAGSQSDAANAAIASAEAVARTLDAEIEAARDALAERK